MIPLVDITADAELLARLDRLERAYKQLLLTPESSPEYKTVKEAYEKEAEEFKEFLVSKLREDPYYFTDIMIDPEIPQFIKSLVTEAVMSVYSPEEIKKLSYEADLQLIALKKYFSRQLEQSKARIYKNPSYAPMFSEAEKRNIRRPSRWIAKQYFSRGIWNIKWGDPRDYGVTVTVDDIAKQKDADNDFKLMAWVYYGIWLPEWGKIPPAWKPLKGRGMKK